jgi:hypothetical protein
MNKDQVQEIMLGVTAVVLAYAVWKHMKPAATITPAFKAASPIAPSQGTAYNPANPGALASGLTNLLAGTVHDLMGGSTSSAAIPTTTDIIDSSLGNVPNYSDINGNDNPDSSVFVNTGEWWQQ